MAIKMQRQPDEPITIVYADINDPLKADAESRLRRFCLFSREKLGGVYGRDNGRAQRPKFSEDSAEIGNRVVSMICTALRGIEFCICRGCVPREREV